MLSSAARGRLRLLRVVTDDADSDVKGSVSVQLHVTPRSKRGLLTISEWGTHYFVIRLMVRKPYFTLGDWDFDLQQYHILLSKLIVDNQLIRNGRYVEDLLWLLEYIYNYWAARFHTRQSWLAHNQALPEALQEKVADFISPSGNPADYFEYTINQVYQILYR